jgi:branched-chain amino acid transport system substrate-binding protein
MSERMALTGYNVLTDDTILPAIGDAALGIVTTAGYTAALDTPENNAFVQAYDRAHKTWPSRYSEGGWVSAMLITAAIDTLKGDLSDRERVREALKNALPKLKTPRGQLQFDSYRQVIQPIFVMKVEKQGDRLVNAIIDTIPNVSQESTWGWWYKK